MHGQQLTHAPCLWCSSAWLIVLACLPAGAALRGLLSAPPAGRVRWASMLHARCCTAMPQQWRLRCRRASSATADPPASSQTSKLATIHLAFFLLQCLDTTTPSASCSPSCASGAQPPRQQLPAAAVAPCSPTLVRRSCSMCPGLSLSSAPLLCPQPGLHCHVPPSCSVCGHHPGL